jgi:hypothetical protein
LEEANRRAKGRPASPNWSDHAFGILSGGWTRPVLGVATTVMSAFEGKTDIAWTWRHVC